MRSLSAFKPNWVSAPGETIMDLLDKQHLSVNSFAEKMENSEDFIRQLIDGYTVIDDSIAKKLENVLGGSSEFWKQRDSQYREDYARIQGIDNDTWLKSLPIKDMVNFGWINDSEDKLTECLNYFGVTDINTWQRKYESFLGTTLFRSSPSFNSDLAAVSAWLRRGEILATNMDCSSWNEELFEQTLIEIKPLTRIKSPKEFIPKIIDLCAKCGVAVVIARAPKGCRASGATKFLDSSRALMMLSFRYLSDDQFWFTFFHEAGHLLLHNNKSTHIEGVNTSESNDEKEANLFAQEILIPHHLQSQLGNIRGNKRQIISFAALAGVSPGIVVGQLQHLGYIRPDYLNSYKRRYSLDDLTLS